MDYDDIAVTPKGPGSCAYVSADAVAAALAGDEYRKGEKESWYAK